MAPQESRRPFKKPLISDQQKRRELSLLRQSKNRRDAQHQARCLASSVFSLQSRTPEAITIDPQFAFPDIELHSDSPSEKDRNSEDIDVHQASKLKGAEGRRWFARQLMLPEWMVDVPDCLEDEWYVFARPAGKRCFVVSSSGKTVSRLRNGSILHYFSSALPNGAMNSDHSGSGQTYCILDCIFHELDQTYYVIDMVCWRGYSLYDCTAEFRFFWLNSKLAETGAFDPPSFYHKYKFNIVTIYNCDQSGLQTAYMGGGVSYVKDGLLFYNKHAHYQTGNTPLALVWKDEKCSQYVIDTDNKGQVPSQQQVVLELLADGKLGTSDDPPVIFGLLDKDFIQKWDLRSGLLLRFALRDDGLRSVDGKVEKADIEYLEKSNRGRASADSYSKILFQQRARHSPLSMDELVASICDKEKDCKETCDDVNMVLSEN